MCLPDIRVKYQVPNFTMKDVTLLLVRVIELLSFGIFHIADVNFKIFFGFIYLGIKTYCVGSSVLDICSNDCLGFPAISAHVDKSVRIWDGRTKDAAFEFTLNGKVTSLFVSPGKFI